ncbi:MAG: cytochrome C oxidase subunit IV family protein [Acidobacteriota bacterium]|jgi:caa(3)-type oxidase subunit IV
MSSESGTAVATTDHTAHDLKTYWQIWAMLLALTAVMLFLDQVTMPRTLFVTVMVAAMLTKASLIAGFFMHLKYEHPFLRATFVVGLLINGTFMFALFIPDAVRIYHMVNG